MNHALRNALRTSLDGWEIARWDHAPEMDPSPLPSPPGRGEGESAAAYLSINSQTDPHGCPGGNSAAFQRWVWAPEGLSPGGTADRPPIQPSLRDLAHPNLFPSVETLGYSHPSLRGEQDLRDEQDHMLVALGGYACASLNKYRHAVGAAGACDVATMRSADIPVYRIAALSSLRFSLRNERRDWSTLADRNVGDTPDRNVCATEPAHSLLGRSVLLYGRRSLGDE